MGTSFSGLQKLVALSLITLIALIAVSQYSKGPPADPSGTATGGAINAMTFSGNGGSAPVRQTSGRSPMVSTSSGVRWKERH